MASAWAWQDPLPTGNDLLAIAASSSGDLWAAGAVGTLLHYAGAAWSPVTSPTASSLRGLWVGGANSAWAVGQGGAIVRWDGRSWSCSPSGTESDLTAVWASGDSDAWAVGTQIILHWDGRAWSSVSSPAEILRGVWGSGPSDVWAVGFANAIYHYDGARWTRDPFSMPRLRALTSVWGSGESDVFASAADIGGFGGWILHWDGSSWSVAYDDPVTGFQAVTGSGPRDVWAAGNVVQDGALYHYDGASWRDSYDVGENLTGVWSDGGATWVVGQGGMRLQNDGASFRAVDSVTAIDLVGVFAASATQAWAVGRTLLGARGILLGWDGSA
jgi:hypothetical protein